jgi:hypothetical protein
MIAAKTPTLSLQSRQRRGHDATRFTFDAVIKKYNVTETAFPMMTILLI